LQKGVRVCGRSYWGGLVNSYGVVLRLDSCFILSSQTVPIPYLPPSICGI
jgi:hypothetical protein